jgi:soluble lytic murein transglycosylase-like protein
LILRRRDLTILVAVALCFGASPAFAEELLYYIQDGRAIFTNTPSRRDAKPLPNFDRGPVRRAVTLPATPFDPYIDMVSIQNGVDPTLVKAVALVESGFNPKARSSKGAQGLMQLMPTTAALYGVKNIRDPYQNLAAGAKHLRNLLDQYEGDVTLALAAYNAGPEAVRRYGGIPAYRETQEYVKKVEANMGRRARPGVKKKSVSAAAAKIEMRVEPDGTITLFN